LISCTTTVLRDCVSPWYPTTAFTDANRHELSSGTAWRLRITGSTSEAAAGFTSSSRVSPCLIPMESRVAESGAVTSFGGKPNLTGNKRGDEEVERGREGKRGERGRGREGERERGGRGGGERGERWSGALLVWE